MPYAMQFLAHQLGSRMELCVIRGYALSEVCLMRGSTVLVIVFANGRGRIHLILSGNGVVGLKEDCYGLIIALWLPWDDR
jgi:hypothetical protein